MRDSLHKNAPSSPDDSRQLSPRRETLRFLRTFARFYEPSMGDYTTRSTTFPRQAAAIC